MHCPSCLTDSSAKRVVVAPASRWWTTFLVAVLAFITLNGCSRPVEIRQYKIPKPPHRMLGAIVTREGEAWFFKLTGPRADVARHVDGFQQFLQSVRFGEGKDAPPQWDLPKGWHQLPGNEQRFATIEVSGADKPMELTVSRLPVPPTSNLDEYRLQNINRWRQQLRIGPLSVGELSTETAQLKTATGVVITSVDYQGTMAPPRAAGRAGMAGMAGMAGHPDIGGADAMAGAGNTLPEMTPSGPKELPFQYAAPEGWKTLPSTGIRRLAFRAGDEDEVPITEITVTNLPAAVNDLLSNINRWRDQVRLKPLTAAELQSSAKPVPMGSVTGQFVEMVGDGSEGEASRQSILGVIAVHGDQAWFFKLKGPRETAAKEKARFEAFVQSVRFPGEGA